MPNFVPETLSVEERLALIDRLCLSIAKDAQQGDSNAAAALDLNRPLEAELVAAPQACRSLQARPFQKHPMGGLAGGAEAEVRVKLPVVIGAAAGS